MKAQHINLCTTVRNALAGRNISFEAVRKAINDSLADCETGDGSGDESESDNTLRMADYDLSKGRSKATHSKLKGSVFSVSAKETIKWKGKLTTPRLFSSWNDEIEATEKALRKMTGECEMTIEIPNVFGEWLNRPAFLMPNKPVVTTADK